MSPKWPNKMDNDDSESGKKGEPMDSPFFYKPILIFFFGVLSKPTKRWLEARVDDE
jgi:hypothetical protein